MARPLTVSNSSSHDSEAPRQRENTFAESHHNRDWTSNAPLDATANDALCCAARNSLQVILSGAEILLEDHLGNLLDGQKELLIKMTENAHHLCLLLSRILGPEEFEFSDGSGERFTAHPGKSLIHGKGKVTV